MVAELGHFALILALVTAVFQVAVPGYGLATRNPRALAMATSAAQVQFALVLLAYVALTVCFVQWDFSVAYVASHTHSDTPLMYRITAVWGGHEGSFLLWGLMLTGWTALVSVLNRRLPEDFRATVLAVLGAISIGFLLFMLLTSNPFDRVYPVPLEGQDLNPLLQDPGMIVHPPTLYMGFVGFSVAFAFAIAALITGKLDTAWVRWMRPWTTAAWAFLTLGITLGSWWAYNELGWGGWWFWDPVENASFMPWLAGTALIHSLAVTEKRGLLKSWTVLLAILCFALSLLGTFLVRSGVIVSVHAFASDPERGVFILSFLAVVVGGALALYAWRAPKLVSEGELKLFSREGLLLLNNVFLVTACFSVLLGTLYPLVVDAFGLGKISVGPPYFNATFFPLMAPLFVLLGLAVFTPWKRGDLQQGLRRLRTPALFTLVAAVALPFALQGESSLVIAGGVWLALWTLATAPIELVKRLRAKPTLMAGLGSIPGSTWGMTLSHLGLGLWMLGVVAVTGYGIERDVRLGPGQEAELSGFTFNFGGVTASQGPNFTADRGTVVVERNGRTVSTLQPEKRLYPSQGSVMTETGVDASLFRDLYVALGEPIDKNNAAGDWSLRLYYKPMIRFVWLGGLLMFIGGLCAALDRRYRLARAARAVPTGAPWSRRLMRLGFVLPAAVLLGLLVLLGIGLTRDPREVPSPLVGKPAPAFALPGLGGTPPQLANADLAGRPVLVNFFASWCVACRVEHPLLMQLARNGIEIIGIDYKDTDADGAQWLQRHGNPYRTVAADREGAMGLDWGVYGVPETYVLSAEGVILYKQIGPVTEAAWRDQIAPLLKATGAGS